jgi:LPS-assembly protein
LVYNFNANFKNFNSLGKKDPKYKNTPQIEGMSDYELVSSLPLIKKDESFEKTLTPKLSLRFSPNDMKDNSLLDRKIYADNIFAK